MTPAASMGRMFSASCRVPLSATGVVSIMIRLKRFAWAAASPTKCVVAKSKTSANAAKRRAPDEIRRLDERHIDDFITLTSTGRVDLHGVAGFLADQRPRDGRGDGHLARLHVRLGFPDD